MRIRRAGRLALDAPIGSIRCGTDCAFGPPFGFIGPLRVRDLDGDGEPEVLLDIFTGGAYCCTTSLVYRYLPGERRYASTFVDWGSPGYLLRDLDGDGRVEIEASAVDFDGFFVAHVASFEPPHVLRFRAGRLIDATREFPGLVAGEARYLLGLYRRLASGNDDLRGLLGAYVADEALLGRAGEGWKLLEGARRAGKLGPAEAARAYVASVRELLLADGYLRANGPIAFERALGGRTVLETVGADGGGPRPLAAGGFRPAWTPDGTSVAFEEGGSIFVTGADGRGHARVAGGSWPAWSPAGDRLAFERDGAVWVNGPGWQARRLTAGSQPAWAPLGRRIAFVRAGHVWVLDLGRGASKRLTGSSASDSAPAWSPDARTIVFSRSGDLYSMRAGGGGVRRLTRGSDPAFAPDGTAIVFSRATAAGTHLFTARPDGSHVRQLTRGAGADTAPAWTRHPPPPHPQS